MLFINNWVNRDIACYVNNIYMVALNTLVLLNESANSHNLFSVSGECYYNDNEMILTGMIQIKGKRDCCMTNHLNFQFWKFF